MRLAQSQSQAPFSVVGHDVSLKGDPPAEGAPSTIRQLPSDIEQVSLPQGWAPHLTTSLDSGPAESSP